MKKINLSFSKKKSQRNIGLDIGNYNLKVAEIEIKDGSAQILNLGMKEIRQTDNISAAIKELLKESGISTKEVNIAIAGENVVARYLSLPKMDDDELKKAMSFALEDHIPFKSEEIYMDYSILGDEPNSKNKIRVFLVASKKELLENRIQLVQEAGLKPGLITMDALAVKNTFYFNYPEKEKTNVALLNVGDKITNLLITKEKLPFFVRDTRFGGDVITNLIQTKLELSREKAQELKHHLTQANKDISEVIKSSLANLLNEIFVSLDFYENLTEQRIEEVYICGGTSQLLGLKEFLRGYLDLEIFNLDPFKNFSFSSKVPQETTAQLLPYFAVAIGLALEEP